MAIKYKPCPMCGGKVEPTHKGQWSGVRLHCTKCAWKT